MPQTVQIPPWPTHCNNMSTMSTKPSITQWHSLIGRTSMQGQTSPLSRVHWLLPILLLSSAERSVSRYVSTSSTCCMCSSLCVNCKLVILLFLAAPFRRLEMQRLKNNFGVDCWEKGSKCILSHTTNTRQVLGITHFRGLQAKYNMRSTWQSQGWLIVFRQRPKELDYNQFAPLCHGCMSKEVAICS